MKKKLMTAIRNFVNRNFPENACRFAERLPNRLSLMPEQLAKLKNSRIQAIRLEFRRNVGTVVQRTYWLCADSSGICLEKDSFLPHSLANLPAEPLLLLRKNVHEYELRGGAYYQQMGPAEFNLLVDSLLETASNSIEYLESLRAQPMS